MFVGSNKCVCGVKKICVDFIKYCNCDVDSDDKWREDFGELKYFFRSYFFCV